MATAAGRRTADLPRIKGHEQGAEAVRECVEGCGELKIEYLTLYAFSAENWQRPKAEVFALMHLLERFLKEKTPELLEKNVRLQAIGRLTDLPAACQRQLHKSIETHFRKQRADLDPRVELRRAAGNHRRNQESPPSGRSRPHRQRDDRRRNVQQTSLYALLSRPRSAHPHLGRIASLEFPPLATFLHRRCMSRRSSGRISPKRIFSRPWKNSVNAQRRYGAVS